MVDRILAWLGAGVIVVGVSGGMLAGAGVAAANDGSASDDGGATTSQSSNPAKGKGDSGEGASGVDGSSAKGPDTKDPDAKDPDAKDSDDESEADDPATDTDEDATDVDGVGGDTTDADGDTDAAVDESTHKKSFGSRESNPSTARVKQADTSDENDDADGDVAAKVMAEKTEKAAVETGNEPETTFAQRKSVVIDNPADTDAEDTATATAVAFAGPADQEADAAAAAPPPSSLLSVVGTIFFSLYGLATQILGGPPVLPPNSKVTVSTSTLHLDCGCNGGAGVDVQADWYVPEVEEGADAPDQMIYLQHGFLARGPWYSYTAAALAEQTHSIVVAPSITSNFFAADACWLGAPPMHEAMARLFDEDNTALADSAEAANYDGPIPDRVLLIGHSLGGGAVIGIAGAMADNKTEDRLAGVIMLDGVPFDPKAVESIEKVDPDIPIYNLASPRYFWNQFGVGTDALVEARPGKFIGVTLANGSHVDSMRGGNTVIQFGQELVAGFVEPENGDAAQILMIDWANEMFAGVTRKPITEAFTIDTPSGLATAVPLPNDLTKEYFLNALRSSGPLGSGLFTFEPACVKESMGTCSASQAA